MAGPGSAGSGASHEPLRVLVVDDDPDDVEIVRDLLEDATGWSGELTVASTYEGGLRAIREAGVDACLLDYRLGTHSGIDFLLEPDVRESTVPVILLTGEGDRAVDEQALQAGAVDFLPKHGLTAQQLERAIRYAVERHRRRSVEEQARFQASLLGAVDQAVVAADPEGRIIYWNRPSEDLFGWSESEALGRALTDVVETDQGVSLGEIVSHVQSGGRWMGELWIRRHDGPALPTLLTASPVRRADGAPRGVILSVTDVSRLKRVEMDLRERVKELRLLLEASQIINDVDLTVSERLERLVAIIPDGWLHPEVTEARIVLESEVVSTPGFRETPWMLTEAIEIDGLEAGRIQVAITEPLAGAGDDPFLDEEAAVLRTLARKIGTAFERGRLTALLTQTVASLQEAVLIVDSRNGARQIRDANPAAERMFGYSRSELVGSTTEMLHVSPQTFRQFSTDGVPALLSKGTFRAEYPLRRKDGTVFDAEQTVTLLSPEDGLDGGVVSVVRDVSAERRAQADLRTAEQRFGVLSREITDVIYVLDPEGEVLYSTQSIESVTGYSVEEFEGTNALELVHPEDRPRVEALLAEVIRTEGEAIRGSYRVLAKDESVLHVESVARNLVDHPAVGGVVVSSRDVTERTLFEERLRQTQRLEAIGRLAGGIAHDFNNILTVIRSQVELTLMDLDDDPVTQELRQIRAAADRAAKLTAQLLAFSRDQVLRPRILDLGEIVVGTRNMLDRVLGEDIKMVYDLHDGVPPVKVDSGQLEQVILNLAVNARDAMPEGGTLTMEVYEETLSAADVEVLPGLVPGRYVTLSISDTGTGIPSGIIEQVFEPFFTTKERGKGTGLGLAMAYGVMKQSGGGIHVDSTPGEGTTFHLRFPAVAGNPEPIDAGGGSETLQHELSGRVLLIEDDPAVRRVTMRILERVGLDVVAVEDGETALEAIDGDIDIVVTDLVLPGMSGRALIDHVRETDPDVPVVVVSGYDRTSPGHRGDLPEDVLFLQKPFTTEALVATLAKALRGE